MGNQSQKDQHEIYDLYGSELGFGMLSIENQTRNLYLS